MGVDETPSRPALELVADGPVGGATGSLTGSRPKDGEHEGSTNRLPGESESAEILDPADVVPDVPGPDIGVHPVSADEVAFPDTRENGKSPVSVAQEVAAPGLAVPVEPGPTVDEAASSSAAGTSTPAELPDHVRVLLESAPLVVSCEDESLWSTAGPFALPRQSALIELLVYLGAARLLAPEPLDPWPGVAVDTLLDEVWTPRARDPQNRESGQTWLRKSLKRLQDELVTAAGGLTGDIVSGTGQLLRLNPATIASDVEAFLTTLARARAARGTARIAAAEDALARRVS